jgi:hypothetical protein
LLKVKKRSKAINMTEGGQKIPGEIAGEN